MRANKWIILGAGTLMLLSLIAAIICDIISNSDCSIGIFSFESNLYLGICSSSLLAVVVAVINYWTGRTRTLENFYVYAGKALRNFQKYENEGDLDHTIDLLLDINEFDYYGLDMALGDMAFIFKNKETIQYIYASIYKPILDLRNMICERSFHFKEYKKSQNGNKEVMKSLIKEIDDVIMCRKTEYIQQDNGTTVMSMTYNSFVNRIREELYGRYYEIMYLRENRIRGE